MWILRLQQQMLLLLPLHLLFLVSPTHVNAMNNSLSLLLFYKVSMRNVPQQKSKVYYLLQMKRCCSTTGTATSGSRGGISSSGSGSGSGSGSFITSSFSSAFLTTAGSFGRTAGGAKCTTRFSRHGILKPSYYQNSHRFTRFYMSTSNSSSSSSSGSISGTNPDTIQLATSLQLPSYWERLGNPRTVMAPMVAQSDLAFRKLCRAYGTELCFTQMIHAHNFVSSNSFQWNHLDVYPWGKRIYVSPSGVRALKGCSSSSSSSSVMSQDADASCDDDDDDEMDGEDMDGEDNGDGGGCTQSGTIYHERPMEEMMDTPNHEQPNQDITNLAPTTHHSHPLIVQIAGHDPQTMSKAAKIILERTNLPQSAAKGCYHGPVAGIDVNCGCPQAIAKKGRYGAFLMEESEDLVCDIISTLRKDLPSNIGVSCKIRLPLQENKLQERICKLIDAGVDLISVHGRTLKENKTKVRECNWDAIAKVVQIAREHSRNPDFPIIANGGIEYSSDVDKCLMYTGASAVMSSEALLENPGIFQQSAMDDVDISPELLFQRQITYCHEYLDLCTLYPPLPGSLGKIGGSFNCIRAHVFKIIHRYLEEHPDLRERLGHPTHVTSIHGVRQLLYQLQERYRNVHDWSTLRSSNFRKSSWYRRHREAAITSRMSTRGQTVESELSGLSIEEKKDVIRQRLTKLKEQRLTLTNR